MSKSIPILDTHMHFWDFKHPEMKWVWLAPDFVHPILGNIDAIKSEAFVIENLWAEARFSDISGFVHVQAAIGSPNPVTETIWITEMAKRSPVPIRQIGDSPLGDKSAPAQLAQHMESPIFAGIRDFNAEVMLAKGEINSQFEESLKILSKNNLVFDLDCEWPNMGAALALARRHPDLKIVLEHLGFPRKRDDEYFTNWKKGMKELAQAPNVTVKISGLPMTDPYFTKESLRKWSEACVEIFTPNRCVLGSNWPVDRLYVSYSVIIDFMRDYISSLSTSEQTAISNGNATKLYNF
jgi:predicted TIM-barrel fold metal-dependent hydrolase